MWGNDGSWVGSDARTIARAVTNREVSASQVLDDHLAHIKARNPELNAVVTVAEDQAIRAADDLDTRIGRGEDVGPLAGVPFTVKDLIATAGVRTTAGSRALEHNVPSVDAPAVAAMRTAGAILVGKTNTPEFGASGLTHNDLFGYTVNPLRPDGVARSPGGSSGGEAAAVASGMSVVGLGTDFGGSVRWPAHCTGLRSVRPTIGRVDPDGQYPGVPSGDHVLTNPATMHGTLQTIGPMARTLDDAALMLRVLSSRQYHWTDPGSVDLARLDITWAPGEGTVPVGEEIAAAAAGAARHLGARPYEGGALSEGNDLFGRLRAVETHTDIIELGTDFGNNIATMLADARDVDRRLVERLWAQRAELVHRLLGEMGDVLVLPVASIPAPPLGDEVFDVGGQSLTWSQALASCRAISVTGLPSVVVPVGSTRSGLPIGVQVVARPWCEHVALAVAARL
ncbi:glutamyl-tRNA(Gln) amidotransferase subunit A [Rhodococcus opacus M213]|uniref:amidase n=1 Tax=Rhodococcus opacus M213 TaxID=1129896 RepID=K8XVW8_RHOOP|nr:amidase [Rhodococcus opacus]EKT82377.1 glutamyl-tRNA(Gln) amidotransferase subunit A [Rhodococcus opacus M213]